MVNTLYQDKSGVFQKKIAVLTIQAIVENRGCKKIGTVSINLAELVTTGKDKENISILNCSDKKAKACISVKGYSLGDSVSDNLSEMSEKSIHSVASENEFSGSLFHDNEHSEIEEENKSRNFGKKPPIFKKNNESYKSEEETLRYIDIKAANSVLEKENQRLVSEKEDVKIQLGIVTEKAKKEREMFCEHANKLDEEIDSIKLKNVILVRKNQKKKEKILEIKKSYEEVLEDYEKVKANFTVAEKVKLMDEVKMQKKIAQDCKERMIKLREAVEDLENFKEISENSCEQLKSLNLKHMAEISRLKRQISDQQEAFFEKVPEDQSNYKKKIEGILTELKKELAEAHNETDEATSRQTEFATEIQKLRMKFSSIENGLKEKVRNLEYELEEKSQEISNLNERLEEEMKNSKKIERKTIVEKEATNVKMSALARNFHDLASEKESIEKNYLEHQRKYVRNRSETDASALDKLQRTLTLYQGEIIKLHKVISEKEAENQELLEKVNQFEHAEEVFNLSDEASSSFSQEQISLLKTKMKRKDNEKHSLLEKNKILEKELELTLEKQKESQKSLENQISSLRIQIISMQENGEKSNIDPKDFVLTMQEESYKQEIEMKKLEIKELKNLIAKLNEDLKSMEKKYMDSKVNLANLELQKENIFGKYREMQDLIKEYSTSYTTMEVEFYKINERFGQTLNKNNELENEVQNLKFQNSELLKRRRKN